MSAHCGFFSFTSLAKFRRFLASVTAALTLLAFSSATQSFVTFESGQVRPLALSPDGNRLFAVNTPDSRLEIFNITANGLTYAASVPVGMEPVALAARTNGEVWVVNHLSDSVSVVDVASTPPRVVRTLLVGDEPRDIVFAGVGVNRAFITTAHRGQNSPYTTSTNPGELTTAGIGRADVWVFDASNLGPALGGTPLTIITLFTDTPRALAVSPDKNTVYVAGFHTGNRTTALTEGAVCDGGVTATPCVPKVGELSAPGGLPAPNASTGNVPQPEVGLIVKYNGTNWVDEMNRTWSDMVRFSLPDKDVFAINAVANPPVATGDFAQVGTVLYNMIVNPVNGNIYVSNTEARNEVRFEGSRPVGSTITTVQGRLHQSRVTVLNGSGVFPRHLNKHINYSIVPSPAGVKDKSLAQPMGMAVSSNGATLYVAAFGSSKVGVFNTTQLENDSFIPDSANHIVLSGGGPSGLALNETRGRLYVLTRFNNSIAEVNTATKTEIAQYTLHNPEPASVVNGRRFLYDANLTSSNGEAACGSCHVFGDFDSLAWDLGDPLGTMLNNPQLFTFGSEPSFHPMKGPMTTQSLRGLADHGAMHWRGDRTGGNDAPTAQPNSGAFDEVAGFKKFNAAFNGLLGRSGPLTDTEMQAFTDFILQVTYPPNPIRALNNSLTANQQAGRDFYFGPISDSLINCNGCHVLDPSNGFFGSDGRSSFENESQTFKIPHLRNMYQKVGMFGMPSVGFFIAGDNGPKGDQIRGFGFLHDGSVDTLLRFHRATVFNFPGGDPQRRQVEQFMFAYDTNFAPIVGQQITLTDTNAAVAAARIDLMIARAVTGEADLVVKGTLGGIPRGWTRQPGGTFKSDKASETTPLTDSQLRALAQTPGQELTYTTVPVGEGIRAGIDRDNDGVLDADENVPPTANASSNSPVTSGGTVQLNGTCIASAGKTITGCNWDNLGGPIILNQTPTGIGSGTVINNVSFTAPTVTQDTFLTFTLTATDSSNMIMASTIVVTIQPAAGPIPAPAPPADSGSSKKKSFGCSIAAQGVPFFERGEWWLVVGFVLWLGMWRRRNADRVL